jgi:hypothetical protein
LPLFRAVTSLLSLAASIFRKSSSVNNRIWLTSTACWILSTCSVFPSVATSFPSAYYDSTNRKENDSAFKVTDTNFNATITWTKTTYLKILQFYITSTVKILCILQWICYMRYNISKVPQKNAWVQIWILRKTAGPNFWRCHCSFCLRNSHGHQWCGAHSFI